MMLRFVKPGSIAAVVLALIAMPTWAVTIDWATIGNPGNAGELSGGATVGGVAYSYRISKYEITNDQYVEFLTAKAADTDPYNLYGAGGAITRGGSEGAYTYSVAANMGNKPVTFVSSFDAIRFVNWLNNGQGTGDTETGAYTLLGGTPTPSNAATLVRNPGASVFLPNEDEWYKAAYYDPTLNSGAGGYWDFATMSNTAPTMATADGFKNISNPGANVANYGGTSGANSVTTVGSAGSLSESYYGTADQSGNVWEWTETLIGDGNLRNFRGGSWQSASGSLNAASRNSLAWFTNNTGTGFRVASVVPEPGSYALAVTAIVGFWRLKRRRK